MLWICLCPGCNDPEISVKNSTVEGTAIINLSAATNSSKTEVFHEVRHSSLLPSVVIDEFGGIADPGQQFNTTDVIDRRLPTRQLIVAAVSEKYCTVSYWRGGYTFGLQTTIFELSDGKVKRKWVSPGGGLNFRDLKNTMESGRILQFQLVPVRIAEKQSEVLLLTPGKSFYQNLVACALCSPRLGYKVPSCVTKFYLCRSKNPHLKAS